MCVLFLLLILFFFFSSRRRHTRYIGDWSSDVCSSDLEREFSWCCSFPWGFGGRGTERRLASWRAAAECSGRQSGRRCGHSHTAGPRSSCQTKEIGRASVGKGCGSREWRGEWNKSDKLMM